MYGGGILIALGWSAIFATVIGLVLAIALAIVADLKGRREELWLEQTFAGYPEYLGRCSRPGGASIGADPLRRSSAFLQRAAEVWVTSRCSSG